MYTSWEASRSLVPGGCSSGTKPSGERRQLQELRPIWMFHGDTFQTGTNVTSSNHADTERTQVGLRT